MRPFEIFSATIKAFKWEILAFWGPGTDEGPGVFQIFEEVMVRLSVEVILQYENMPSYGETAFSAQTPIAPTCTCENFTPPLSQHQELGTQGNMAGRILQWMLCAESSESCTLGRLTRFLFTL